LIRLISGTEETKQILGSEFVVSGISCVTTLAIGLTRIQKEMVSLLHKISVVDTLLGIKTDILRSNDIYMWMQVTLLAFVLFIVYANDFVPVYSDFIIGLWAIAICVCNFIRSVKIKQFMNLILLLKQKFHIFNK
jgi:hypothetical protein